MPHIRSSCACGSTESRLCTHAAMDDASSSAWSLPARRYASSRPAMILWHV
ncbi:Uncharacterised protein [Mycobacteroides abscessus]|nr:Uncharacterised protein [Mycobacteroides abscessus]